MFRVLGLACVLILGGFAAPSAEAQNWRDSRALRSAFGACGDPCVIHYSPGGEVEKFQAAARAVRAGARRLVVIDGPCISACAVFADMARMRVCITRRASFGFHKATVMGMYQRNDGSYSMRRLAREDPPHSRDIANWVYRNGGFPARGVRTMNARQASAFFRRCPRHYGRRS